MTKKHLTPYLNDSGENQLWESNAVGLAMDIFKHQVVELFNESILGRGSRKRDQIGAKSYSTQTGKRVSSPTGQEHKAYC